MHRRSLVLGAAAAIAAPLARPALATGAKTISIVPQDQDRTGLGAGLYPAGPGQCPRHGQRYIAANEPGPRDPAVDIDNFRREAMFWIIAL